MAYRSDTYATVANDFKEWLRIGNVGENITDLALRFLNRAQVALNIHKPWKGITKRYQSLSLTSGSGTYPVDCAKIVRCYEDTNGDKLPDKFYFERTTRTDDGYIIRPTFTKAAGWSATIDFYSTPSNTIYLDYIQILTDFAGSGTEYSFFPAEMLLKKAQILFLEEDGRINTDEYKMLLSSLTSDLIDFSQNNIENLDMRMEIKDSVGRNVSIEGYNLADGPSENSSSSSRYEPDVDV